MILFHHLYLYFYLFCVRSQKASRGMNCQDYNSQLKPLGSFNTVQGFWRYWNNIVDPSRFPNDSNLRLFKRGIKPMWEDASNIHGGRWVWSTLDLDFSLLLLFVIMIIRTHWIHLCCWICCLILVYRLSPVKRLILLKYLWISCSASLASNSSITRTLYVAFYTLVWALVVLRSIAFFPLYFAGMTLFNAGFYHYSAGWFSASEPREILSVSGMPMAPIKRWLKRPLPHSYRYCVRVASPRRRSPTASTWYEYFSFPSIRAQG